MHSPIYQDRRRPFKIDYAKAIYGGPFSTEQVEDVKTFLRIIFISSSANGSSSNDHLFAYQAFSFFSLYLDLDSKACYTYGLISMH